MGSVGSKGRADRLHSSAESDIAAGYPVSVTLTMTPPLSPLPRSMSCETGFAHSVTVTSHGTTRHLRGRSAPAPITVSSAAIQDLQDLRTPLRSDVSAWALAAKISPLSPATAPNRRS